MGRQSRQLQVLGWDPSSPSGQTTLAVNAAATWLAYGFVPDRSGLTLANVRAFFSATAGSLVASDVTYDLFSDNAGAGPNVSIEGPKSCATAPSGSGWYNWTGFTTALTQGQQYWLVEKNVNAVPGTNFPTNRYGQTGSTVVQGAGSGAVKYGWHKQQSNNSGASWVTVVLEPGGWRVGYGDGTYDGSPLSGQVASNDLVYAARESGVKFTTPPGPSLNVAGLSFFIASPTGSPTGGAVFNLYSGSGAAPTLLGTTNAIAAGNLGSAAWYSAYFSSAVVVPAGTVLRATLADNTPGGADSASNAYKLSETTWDSDGNSLALLPFEGTVGKTYAATNNTSFADTSGALMAFGLLLDTAGEFAASAAGGVPMSRVRAGM